MSKILENITTIKEQIVKFATSVKRDPSEITLLAVSKTKPVADILEAYKSGQRHFGESYAQEACAKIDEITNLGMRDIKWHFIGPVQSNKTKIIAEHFDVVESIDRIKIAERLNNQRPSYMEPLKVLIQVNISGEAQKSGCTYEELPKLVEFITNECKQLTLVGLMGIAENAVNKADIVPQFDKLKSTFDDLKSKGYQLSVLSLGMTHDMEYAISSGSTEVRIGTAIFGPRQYHN